MGPVWTKNEIFERSGVGKKMKIFDRSGVRKKKENFLIGPGWAKK